MTIIITSPAISAELFNTLFDEVLVDVPGVTQDVALNAIRKAAIEFCEKSKAWSYPLGPMDGIAGQPRYQFYSVFPYSEVCGIIECYYNGLPLVPATTQQMDTNLSVSMSAYSGAIYGDLLQSGDGYPNGIPWRQRTGTPLFYVQERADEFRLVPFPDTTITGAIVLQVALKPMRTAPSIEQWVMEKYFDELASGAKSKLYAMAKKPWTDANLSVYHRNLFDAGIRAASATSSYKLPNMAVSPSPI